MGSVTCNGCGFVSFATSEICKQCGTPLAAGNPGAQSWQGQAAPHPHARANFEGQRSKGMAASALVCGLVGVPALVVAVLIGLALGVSPAATGLLGFALFCVSSLLGIVLGIAATMKANKRPTEFGGKGLAVAGIVLGALSLISVVPIGIISAIAIPNLLAARRAANEGAAIGSLRALASAQADYESTVGNGEFGTIDELRDARLIDAQLSAGVKHGYRFELETEGDSYVVTAAPLDYPNSGVRSFYFSSDEGVIRAADKRGRAAGEDDPALDDYRGPQAMSADGREDLGVGYAPRGR